MPAYQGGKFFLAKHITAIMEPDLAHATAYVEPFLGAFNLPHHITRVFDGPMHLSDLNIHMVTLMRALLDGWIPPEDSPLRPDYERYRRDLPEDDPMTGLIGCALSFGGVWYKSYRGPGSYGDSAPQDFWKSGRTSCAKKTAPLIGRPGIHLTSHPYDQACVPRGSVVYCDPPYAGTIGYSAVDAKYSRKSTGFDHDAFWAWVRETARNSVVYVSEFSAPEDIPEVWSKARPCAMAPQKGYSTRPIDKLFRLAPEGMT